MVETPHADAIPHDKIHWDNATVRVYDVMTLTPEAIAELKLREEEWATNQEETDE